MDGSKEMAFGYRSQYGQEKVTNMEVKKQNRNRVFRYIYRHGTVSNPDIAHEMNMSLPTVTQITKELIEKGLVEEKGELQSTGGRRAKALSAAVNIKQAVGLDITKNHISLVLTNLAGEILNYERIYQPYASEDLYYREVNKKLERFLDESGASGSGYWGLGSLFRELLTWTRGLPNRMYSVWNLCHLIW